MRARIGFIVAAIVLSLFPVVAAPTASIAASPVPSGFTVEAIFDGYSSLDQPVAVKFAPDDRVFVAEHDGRIQVFDDIYDSSPIELIDIRDQVHGWWDRGFLGLALDPDFESTPILYGLYTWDPEGWGSNCPNPPGATNDGCVVNGRLSRWTVQPNNTVGPETVLLEGYWCQQFPSHSIGDLVFGSDGALYVSAGDGASFNGVDYGQHGGDPGSPTPKNPCDDAPAGIGGDQTTPTAEGGALRSQDLLTSGDSLSYDGAILRIDPATGNALSSNPLYDDGQSAGNQPDEARVIAFGLRNPFRMTGQPGTDDLWIGDVGWSNWEELNRIENPTDGVVENFGWPCYEGGNGTSAKHSGYDGLDLDLCEDLYSGAIGSGVTAPHWAYRHSSPPGTPDMCNSGGSSITGLAFVTDDSYPASYDGALLIGDHSNRCVWMMKPDGGGVPNPSDVSVLIDAIDVVDIEFGPGGEAYIVDFEAGEVLRLARSANNAAPEASIQANPVVGKIPLEVTLDASESSDAQNDQLTYAWDLDDDGAFDDASGRTVEHIFTAVASHDVSVEVTDFHGASDVETVTIEATETNTDPPVLSSIDDLTVDEDETAEFTAVATDPDLPSQSLTFTVEEGPGTINPSTGDYSWTPGESDDGIHDVVIRVTDNGAPPLFDQKTVRITVNEVNLPPTAAITAPTSGLTWKVDDEIAVSGFGTDPDQGNLPASALEWDVSIHHCETPVDCHVHNVASHVGDNWSFAAPDHEFDTRLTVTLTVTDDAGVTDAESVDILPETNFFSIRTEPSGLQVVMASSAQPAPFTKEVLWGSRNEIVAISPQTIGDRTYEFVTWDDGVTTAGRDEVATGSDKTFTAIFSEKPVDPPIGLQKDAVGSVDPSQGFWRLLTPSINLRASFFFGNPGDAPFVGDWTCDGTETPGMYRQSDGFAYLRDTNTEGIADRKFFFGNPADIPLAGDFNGDGCDTLSIYRPSEARFYIINELGENEGGLGAADYSFLFGNLGDKPVVGDWDGNGIDEIGLHRESSGLFYWRNTLATGNADGAIFFGNPGDRFLAGDWGIVDGADTPAVFRPANTTFYFRHTLTEGNADSQFVSGEPGWLPVAGIFGSN
jgi:glucose/arabinose dehydrogenase